MLNDDKALPGINLAVRGQMLITLEPHGIFQSNFLIFTY